MALFVSANNSLKILRFDSKNGYGDPLMLIYGPIKRIMLKTTPPNLPEK